MDDGKNIENNSIFLKNYNNKVYLIFDMLSIDTASKH
jgi:L-rhamnose mutarotase